MNVTVKRIDLIEHFDEKITQYKNNDSFENPPTNEQRMKNFIFLREQMKNEECEFKILTLEDLRTLEIISL